MGVTKDTLVQTIRIFKQDIRMRFGIQKCATIALKRGKKETNDGILLPNGEMMKDLENESYKYLGVLESSEIKTKEVREKVRNEYTRRVKLLLESKLNGGNVISRQSTLGLLLY